MFAGQGEGHYWCSKGDSQGMASVLCQPIAAIVGMWAGFESKILLQHHA